MSIDIDLGDDYDQYDQERLDRAAHTEPVKQRESLRESIPNRRTLFRGEGSHVYTDEDWEGVDVRPCG